MKNNDYVKYKKTLLIEVRLKKDSWAVKKTIARNWACFVTERSVSWTKGQLTRILGSQHQLPTYFIWIKNRQSTSIRRPAFRNDLIALNARSWPINLTKGVSMIILKHYHFGGIKDTEGSSFLQELKFEIREEQQG